MNWTTIENAIQAWVVAGSGLSASKVLWAGQNAPRPSGTWISISPPDIQRVGQDWVSIEDNPTPSAGAEIIRKVRGMRRLTFTLQCYADDSIGASGAVQLLESVVLNATLPSRREALNTAKVGIAQFSNVRSIGAAFNSVFEPRAVLEVSAFAVSETEETSTYIKTVDVTQTV